MKWITNSCHRNLHRASWLWCWRLGALGVAMALLLVGYLRVRVAIARYRAPQPQAIFVLGGGHQRERLATDLARQHPALPVWISSGISPERSCTLFQEAGIDPTRVRRDYRAVDTVTNFTSQADDLAAAGFEHIYLITNDYHQRRAMAIAAVTFGSRGIAVSPVLFPRPDITPEPPTLVLRDVARSLVWLFTSQLDPGNTPAIEYSCPERRL